VQRPLSPPVELPMGVLMLRRAEHIILSLGGVDWLRGPVGNAPELMVAAAPLRLFRLERARWCELRG